jgi:hypothetical protein
MEGCGMAAIERRTNGKGDTTYRVKVRLKGYPVSTATFRRLTDARISAQKTETAVREHRHFGGIEAKRHTLGELIARYIDSYLPMKRSGKDQLRQLKWWKAKIGA